MKHRRVSLVSAMVSIIFILNIMVIGIVAINGMSSYKNMAKKQSEKLLSLIFDHTEDYLDSLLKDASNFNRFLRDQITYNNSFSDEDLSSIEQHIHYIMESAKKRHPQLSAIGYGDEQGRFIGFRINPDHTTNLMLKDKRTNDNLIIYSSDTIISEENAVFEDYIIQDRPWYSPVKKNPVTQWSDVYVNYDELMELTITVMSPIFHKGDFVGIVTSDVSLNVLDDFLKNDESIATGIVYIIDKDGNILAHSSEESHYYIIQGNVPAYAPLSALNVDNPVISASIMKIMDENIHNSTFSFKLDKSEYFGYVGELNKSMDLGLRSVIVIPEDDIMSDVKTQQFQSLASIFASITLTIIMGLWLLSIIIKPINKVTGLAKALSNSDFSVSIDKESLYISETYELVNAFNHMTYELKKAFSLIRENEHLLEAKVNEKTAELEKTYNQLLEKEKLASLGSLVAGISHEINTPLGISVSACSYLIDQNEKLVKVLDEGGLTKSNFLGFLENSKESLDIMNVNLNRAAELISNFKQISVDQSASIATEFFLGEYLESIFLTLKHEYKNKDFKYNINCHDKLEIFSYPGAISHIFTNLIMNSLRHGFKPDTTLIINIDIKDKGDNIFIRFSDNGSGIPAKDLKHIFDPFFTTKRNEGGSGLGLSIVYNTVTSTLGGNITCDSKLDVGTWFTIILPKSI